MPDHDEVPQLIINMIAGDGVAADWAIRGERFATHGDIERKKQGSCTDIPYLFEEPMDTRRRREFLKAEVAKLQHALDIVLELNIH